MACLNHCYFFGTFNPVHIGHLMLANAVIRQCRSTLGIQRVIFVPTGMPPHRSGDTLLPALDRYNLVKAAIAHNPAFEVSDCEVQADKPCFTVETLKRLAPSVFKGAQAGQVRIPLLMGSDTFATLGSWFQADVLIQHGLFLQVVRPESPLLEDVMLSGQSVKAETVAIEMPPVAISATWIRERIADDPKDIRTQLRYVMPAAALDYFCNNNLHSCF